MDSRTRLLTAWSGKEPDRVPIEMNLYEPARGMPGADEILAFEEHEADNFRYVPGFDWGFIGLESHYAEEVIEDRPGEFKRLRHTQVTPAGTFTAISLHPYGDADPYDCHWEKRYIATLEDFARLAKADRDLRPFDEQGYCRGCAEVGDRGLPGAGLFHPLGVLVRHSALEEVYQWLVTEDALVTEYLERCTEQICASLDTLRPLQLPSPPILMTAALEMLIPPWLGKARFHALVFPYDRRVNEMIHSIGARHRAHCHGNSGEFLALFADMGIDAVEPLEPPPYGDNLLARAKQEVGNRMLLSGNIVTQAFHLTDFTFSDVRELVKQAIHEGAPGGGFTLKTTGGAVGNGKTREQCIRDIDCNLALIDAWREFATY